MSRRLLWLAVTAAIVLLDGDFIHVPRSLAQSITSALAPTCSAAGICIADLDGNGKQQIVVSSVRPFDLQNLLNYSYVIIINNNGVVRKKICWVDGANNTTTACPALIVQ